MKPTAIAVIGGAAILVLVFLFTVGLINSEAALKVQYDAQLKENNAEFDNTWKTISQSFQVADTQKNALKDIFTSYAGARSGGGSPQDGTLAKWVQESVPNVDTKVYTNLQNIIAASRDRWTERQARLIDIAREYNTPLHQMPGNLVLALAGYRDIDPQIVTSTKTQAAFSTGTDDDVKLH